ncbi:alpha-hydroxy-acid oxidizing enzyme [Paractinoplanes rishiriensis]|uniref:Alpha-hydroxy-acid oxidizing enzyme n=1 Tax=Paractinoplanes rishiriensis TaxID=1050105 RepID=A0A919K6R1_9ACTN|nr:alpha-hydroxy acid oxidase [Actinoplanes rishiriensis]GIE99543.1 alpha-hydroxy-acid oxidizing enzyme [Actinoplanes rishiriensis]
MDDYRSRAQAGAEPGAWDYLEGGAGAERTLAANVAAFQEVTVVPRVLVDVTTVDTAVEVCGARLAAPIGVAPVAYQRLWHPDGEAATAAGAAATGTLMIASMFASARYEEIAEAGGARWLQLYVLRDRAILLDLVARARAAGFTALVVTVDTPRLGDRRRDVRNSFAIPPHAQSQNIDPETMALTGVPITGGSALATHVGATYDPGLRWEDISWLADRTGLPVVLKGILDPSDATRAVDAGAAGIVVSNHGGRQLDGALATLDALPAVAEAVEGRIPVLVDGGVRRGVDVLVCRALGADVVLVGRPPVWGLAAGGAEGVAGVLGGLRAELELAMALTGRPCLADLTPAMVRRPSR